jgi:N-sulfoglucosamine sulfohydrolase
MFGAFSALCRRGGCLAWGVGLIVGLAVSAAEGQAAPPHLVLVVSDDQSPDAGCYGNPVIQTPHLDRLAADGIRFDQALATTASCSASRSVILTGLHNHATGQYGHTHAYHHFRTFDRVRSLPVELAELGYQTVRIGKFHVEPESVYPFEVQLSANPRDATQMAERVAAFLAERDDPRPLFLYFCTADPHRSGQFREDIAGRPDSFGNLPTPRLGLSEPTYSPGEVLVPDFLPDTAICRAELAQYYQSVSRVDAGLGRLRQALDEYGLAENMVLIYTSDHGIAFPGAKTTVYEPGLRVPLVVHDARSVRRGQACAALVSLVDLTPTLLALAGGTFAADRFHGRSLSPLLAEPQRSVGWDRVYASHTFHEVTMYYPMRVVRTERFKLIWNLASGLPYPFASDLWEAPTWQDLWRRRPDGLYGRRAIADYLQRPAWELYDLGSDPDELHNLAESPEHAQVLDGLRAELRDFQERTGDPWVSKWSYE